MHYYSSYVVSKVPSSYRSLHKKCLFTPQESPLVLQNLSPTVVTAVGQPLLFEVVLALSDNKEYQAHVILIWGALDFSTGGVPCALVWMLAKQRGVEMVI